MACRNIGDAQRVRIDAVHCGRELLAHRIVAAGRIVPETTATIAGGVLVVRRRPGTAHRG